MTGNSLRDQKIAQSPRGSKKGWPTVSGQVPPRIAEMLAHLEANRGIRRTNSIQEAVEMLLQSYGYRIEAA